MPTERILITVRTYPTLSKRYTETVCTGGITDSGEWRRLYPVQWRALDEEKKYHLYDVIEVQVRDESSDGRPESRRIDASTLKIVDRLKSWESKVPWVKPTVVRSLEQLRTEGRTLSPVEVREVLDFKAEATDPDWSPAQQEILRQDGLFGGPSPLEKIPYDFRLVWIDGDGIQHDSKFIDWEYCQAWRNFRSRPNALEYLERAWREQRFSEKQSIYFYMGNFKQHPQHFGICGVFTPPKGLMNEQSLWG